VSMHRGQRALLAWSALGLAGFVLVPWYALPDNVFALGWIAQPTSKDNASALVQALLHQRAWLLPIGVLLMVAAAAAIAPIASRTRARALVGVGVIGFA